MQHLSFCGWLISSSIMSSSFTQVVACVQISFLLWWCSGEHHGLPKCPSFLKLNNIPFVCMKHIYFSIHLPAAIGIAVRGFLLRQTLNYLPQALLPVPSVHTLFQDFPRNAWALGPACLFFLPLTAGASTWPPLPPAQPWVGLGA